MGLGLAIGMDALRACKASPRWEGLLLRWRGAAPLPRGLIGASPRDENIANVTRFRQLLTEVFQRHWFRGRLQVGLPDTSVRVRLLFADVLPEDAGERRKYLLWRLADALDVKPERTRLGYMVLPSPLPGCSHAVLCAVSRDKVIQQYQRALAESGVRYSGIVPSSVLLFNLFHRELTGPSGALILLIAFHETSSTSIVTLEGCPIFWRTRPRVGVEEGAAAPASDLRGELLRDISEAMVYVGGELGVGPPARILVTGPLAEGPDLAGWLAAQLDLPVDALDPSRLVRHIPRRLRGEGWNHWEAALGAAAQP